MSCLFSLRLVLGGSGGGVTARRVDGSFTRADDPSLRSTRTLRVLRARAENSVMTVLYDQLLSMLYYQLLSFTIQPITINYYALLSTTINYYPITINYYR